MHLIMGVSGWFKYKQFRNSGEIYSLLEKNVFSDLHKQVANV